MTPVDCLRPGGLELTDRLVAAAALPPGAVVLDVGCGAGATVARLEDDHGLQAIGLDASGDRVRRAREARPDLVFTPGRAEALPYPDASFDGVLCECVLSTVDDAGAVMAEIGRVVRPRGAVMLSDLYVRAGSDTAPGGGMPSLGRREEVEALLAAAGLAMEVWEDQSAALGRYLWDLAGSGERRPPAPERRSASAAGRRFGYFICVARQTERAGKGEP